MKRGRALFRNRDDGPLRRRRRLNDATNTDRNHTTAPQVPPALPPLPAIVQAETPTEEPDTSTRPSIEAREIVRTFSHADIMAMNLEDVEYRLRRTNKMQDPKECMAPQKAQIPGRTGPDFFNTLAKKLFTKKNDPGSCHDEVRKFHRDNEDPDSDLGGSSFNFSINLA